MFAVFVAVSITGLFVRRFAARPKWLGELSPESGVIAALILILMLTYLGGFWIGDGSAAGKGSYGGFTPSRWSFFSR